MASLDLPAGDPDLFLQDQPALDDEDLFDDGDDRHTVFFTQVGHRLDDAPDGDAFDFDLIVEERLVDLVLDLVRDRADPNCVARHTSPRDGEFFGRKCQEEIVRRLVAGFGRHESPCV